VFISTKRSDSASYRPIGAMKSAKLSYIHAVVRSLVHN